MWIMLEYVHLGSPAYQWKQQPWLWLMTVWKLSVQQQEHLYFGYFQMSESFICYGLPYLKRDEVWKDLNHVSVFCITIYKVLLTPLEVFLALWRSWNVYGIDTVFIGILTVVTILNPQKQEEVMFIVEVLSWSLCSSFVIRPSLHTPILESTSLYTLYIHKVMFSVTAQNLTLQTYSWRYFLYSSAAWWWNLVHNYIRGQMHPSQLGNVPILKLEIHSIKSSLD